MAEKINFKFRPLEMGLGLLLIFVWLGTYIYHFQLIPAFAYFFLLFISFRHKAFANFKEPAIFLGASFLAIQLFRFVPSLGNWPAGMFIIAAVSIFALRMFSNIDLSSRWSLKFSRNEWLSFLGIVLPSVIVLSFYYRAFPEVAKSLPMPDLPSWSIPLVIIGAAVVNGLAEELVYRFTFQQALLKSNGVVWSILMQALAFGFLHYQNGFPQGGVGVFLTTLFGVLIGVQYYRTRSASLAWMTHSVTDAVMFAIIIYQK